MNKTNKNSASFYNQVFSLLAPDQCIIVEHDQGLVSVEPAEKFNPDLFNYAKMLSGCPGLPGYTW